MQTKKNKTLHEESSNPVRIFEHDEFSNDPKIDTLYYILYSLMLFKMNMFLFSVALLNHGHKCKYYVNIQEKERERARDMCIIHTWSRRHSSVIE